MTKMIEENTNSPVISASQLFLPASSDPECFWRRWQRCQKTGFMGNRTLVLEAHHTTHIEVTQLTLEELVRS